MENQSTSIKLKTDDRKLRRISYILVLALFGGVGVWAGLAPLSSAVHVPGQIMVENYRKSIQHLEGGIIKSIDVHDGDWVEKGQTLLVLDDTQSRSQLEIFKGQYMILLAKEARLIALSDDQPKIVFPNELLEANDDPRAKDAMQVQLQIFLARKQSHQNEIQLYQEQINQIYAKERGLTAQKTSRDHLTRSFESELSDYQTLFKEGYTDKQTVRDLERRFAESEGQSGELQSSLAALGLQISEIKIKILLLKKQLQNETIKELAEVQASQFDLREKIRALEQTVARSVIKAPEAGKVLGLSVHTIGAVIRPSLIIMEIVPQNEKLLVEAKVMPVDIDRIKIGQSAEIRFSVFKTSRLPHIYGKVLTLSADSLVTEDAQKTSYYLARLEVEQAGLDALAKLNLELLPGMPVELLINTGKRTFFQYMIGPLNNVVAHSLIEE